MKGLIGKMEQYESLLQVLHDAYVHASRGKGAERHGSDEPFEKQHMVSAARVFGVHSPLYQAHKKIEEAPRLLESAGVHAYVSELLGAINYIAGAIILAREKGEESSN